ncbi:MULTISPECIES: RNA polymerase sigma factor [Bacillaceae]|uniref:RNA polymerase sigma factor n=1 Tax=Bacillaceae TaxID=186817 RepID=UPI0005EF6514|nr:MULTISPECIES: sigma-70 family RNA polymerase sigma factor [Bacillaceae]
MTEFNEVYNQYFGTVYKYVFTLCKNATLSEDITQETFFKALNSIDTFNGECKLSVWLCQIAKNSLYTHLKKESRFDQNMTLEKITDDKSFEERLGNKETAFQIHKLVHELNEPYKEVFSLRTFGELSFSQIGELFEKTESWARVTYYRAKTKIKGSIT